VTISNSGKFTNRKHKVSAFTYCLLRGYNVGPSKILRARPKRNTLRLVEKDEPGGNNNVETIDNSASTSHQQILDVLDPAARETRLYKIALSIFATEEERVVFDLYKKEVKESGWELIPVPASTRELSAYAMVPEGVNGRRRAADFLAESILSQAVRGLRGE
jgi:hypothetical protein